MNFPQPSLIEHKYERCITVAGNKSNSLGRAGHRYIKRKLQVSPPHYCHRIFDSVLLD